MVLFALPVPAQSRRLETAVYRTGAWFAPVNEAQREMYLKGGFTMVPYSRQCAEWAVENGMVFIAAVHGHGLPADVARPFERADGTETRSVGLFTHVNFNAGSVEEWWRDRVPQLVREMPHAEHVSYWKVHNEFGYHARGIYDYSPGSIRRYREWLHDRHGDIGTLNARWRTTYASIEQIEPPRTRIEMQKHLSNWLEWRRFTCWNFADYFRRTGDLIRTVVPEAAVSDNVYTTDPIQGWDNFELARHTDFIAYDIYAAGRWDRLLTLLEHARCAAGAWDKPFIMMEYHAGPNDWITDVRHRHLVIEAFSALARECRALQWFRWIPGDSGREQGIHGMMDTQGRPTERFTAVAEISAFTQRLAPLLLRAKTQSPVALLTSADDAYLAHARGSNPWENRRRWDLLARVLSMAGMPCDQIDPGVLTDGDMTPYDVIIAGHLEILGDAAVEALHAFASDGGTVIVHPDSALLDAYGHQRSGHLGGRTIHMDGPWTTRQASPERALPTTRGQRLGGMIRSTWELPVDAPAEGEGGPAALARSYRQLLMEHAGVSPVWEAEGGTRLEDLDVRVLDTGTGTVVVATWLGQGSAHVKLTLPRITDPCRAYLLNARTAEVRPLATQCGPSGLRLAEISLDPAVLILVADRPWQPLLGIEAPKTMYPGVDAGIRVTLDNLGDRPVTGELMLRAASGWTVEALESTAFAEIPPGGRAAVRFRLGLPGDLVPDRFAVEYPLVAEAHLTDSYAGVLTTRHLPIVLPRLDVTVTYEDHILNPWQELTPPILRWGWNREVRIAPPPPVSCAALCPLSMTVRSAPGLREETAFFTVAGMAGARVMPGELPLHAAETRATLQLWAPQAGRVVLETRVGDEVVHIPLTAGVHTETVEAVAREFEPVLPTGWTALGVLAVGARDAAARGTPVTVDWGAVGADPRRIRVLGASGEPTAFSQGGDALTVAADVLPDSVAAFTVARAPEDAPALPVVDRIHIERPDDRTVRVRGDTYTVCFDTTYGVVRWMETAGRRSVTERTGFVGVTADGDLYAPGTDEQLEAMALGGSAIEAEVSFVRRQRDLRIQESWRFEAHWIDLTLEVTHDGRRPLTFASLDFELGAVPAQLTQWRRWGGGGPVLQGALPTGFGPVGANDTVDLLDSEHRGLALILGRCALMTKWQSGFRGIRHGPGRTVVGLLGKVRLDPGDALLAELSLLPHGPGPVDVARPTIVTSWKPATE